MGDSRDVRDHVRLIDLAVAVLEHPHPDRPWPLVLDALVSRFEGCGAVLSEVRRSHPETTEFVGIVQAIRPVQLHSLPLEGLLGRVAGTDPLIRHYLTTGDLAPHSTGDVIDLRDWRRTAAYAMAKELMGARCCVSLPLTAAADRHRGLTITLPTAGMDERDRLFLYRAQPLLIALDHHLRNLDRWRRATAPAGGGHDSAAVAVHGGLTPREVTVLALLADAHTATAIGRRLHISPRTVQKHVENLYRKLGTNDRVSTLRLAHSTGLLPGDVERPASRSDA